MEINYEKLRKIMLCTSNIATKDEKDNEINDKLSYALKRFSDKNERVISTFSAGETDIMRDYASVDDKGNFITENGLLKYTKENQKELDKSMNKWREENKCEIIPYVCKDVTRTQSLSLWIQLELDGILLICDPKIKEFEND